MAKMNWNKVREQNRASRYGLEIDFSVGADPNKIPPNYTPPQSSGFDRTVILHGRLEPMSITSPSNKAKTQKSYESKCISKPINKDQDISDPLHKLHQCPYCDKQLLSKSLNTHIVNDHKKQLNKSKVKFHEKAIVVDWECNRKLTVNNTPSTTVKCTKNNPPSTTVKCTKCNAMLNLKNVQRHMRKVHSANSDIMNDAN